MGGAEAGFIAAGSSGSCLIIAEKRICKPAVPFTEAALPARVVTSYTSPGWADEVCVMRKLSNAVVAALTTRLGWNMFSFIVFLYWTISFFVNPERTT